MSTKRNKGQIKSLVGAACLLALTGCDYGGVCFPKTEDELSSISSACYDVRIVDTDIETIDSFEFNGVHPPFTAASDFHEVSIINNRNLTHILDMPESVSRRVITDNNNLSSVDLDEASGLVDLERNIALESVSYSIGQRAVTSEQGTTTMKNRLFVWGNSPLALIQVSCLLSECELDLLSIGGIIDLPAGINELTNEVTPELPAPDVNNLTIHLDNNITVNSLDFAGIKHISSLQMLYNINIRDSVLIGNLPEIEDGEIEAFHQHLTDNGFTGEFIVCSMPGYPPCCEYTGSPDCSQ